QSHRLRGSEIPVGCWACRLNYLEGYLVWRRSSALRAIADGHCASPDEHSSDADCRADGTLLESFGNAVDASLMHSAIQSCESLKELAVEEVSSHTSPLMPPKIE
ncbi:hypothetical protein TNCV_2552811, partial [Trichonephila clavipes]